MGVAVVVCGHRLHFRRGAAAVSGFAAGRLKLDGGVLDMEAIAQGAVEPIQYAAALRHRHFGNRDMTG